MASPLRPNWSAIETAGGAAWHSSCRHGRCKVQGSGHAPWSRLVGSRRSSRSSTRARRTFVSTITFRLARDPRTGSISVQPRALDLERLARARPSSLQVPVEPVRGQKSGSRSPFGPVSKVIPKGPSGSSHRIPSPFQPITSKIPLSSPGKPRANVLIPLSNSAHH